MSNFLTDSRKAIWDSVANYAETSSSFNQKYRSDDAGQAELFERQPTFADLPALVVEHIRDVPEWFTNTDQKTQMLFEVIV
jgi:hypothetical protein